MSGLIISSSIFDGTNDVFARFDGRSVGWSRTRARVGGDLDGRFTITGDLETLNNLWRVLPGYDVREEEGGLPWRGFVWATTLHHAGVSKTLSYETLHNAVKAKFKGLVVNGGFEVDGSGTTFLSWTELLSGAATVAAETTAANIASGEQSAKFSGFSGSAPTLYQDCVVKPHQTYRLSFSTRGAGADAGSYAAYDVTNSAYIVSASTGNATTKYKKITSEFVTPDGCVSVRVYLSGSTTGANVWFDDIELVRIDAAGEVVDSYTDWYTNAESIARYGRKELIINADKTSPEKAETQAQNKLTANAWPKPSKPRINDGGQNRTYLEVECVGYWATAFFKYVDFENSSQLIGANETISDLITAVLGDDCDWLSAVNIQTNSDEYQAERNDDITAGALIERVIADDYRLMVDNSQGVIYEAVGTSPSLYRQESVYTESPGGKMPVDAYRVEAGIVVRDLDWPTSPGHYAGDLQYENDYIANEWEVTPDGKLKYKG